MTAVVALDIAERCAAIAILLSVAELFVSRHQLRPGGALHWRVLVLRRPSNLLDRLMLRSRAAPVMDLPGVLGLALLELAGAAAMFVAPRLIVGPVVCLTLHIVLSRRHAHGTDGSDDMLLMLLGAAVARCADPAAVVQGAAAAFLCGQACLAYLTSGLSKAQSRVWWNGSGLRGTLCTRMYGHPLVTRLVSNREVVTRIAGPATIVWESLFVLAVPAGPIPTLVALALAAGFHVACAFIMGLASFVWAFLGTFPSVYFVSQWLTSHLAAADRAALVLACAVSVLSTVSFLAGRTRSGGGSSSFKARS
jgi:hypothetical protein